MNNLVELGIIAILFISNIVWIFLFIDSKKKARQRPDSAELSEFMRDLLNGSGLVKVTRVDTSNVMLRSPRHGNRG